MTDLPLRYLAPLPIGRKAISSRRKPQLIVLFFRSTVVQRGKQFRLSVRLIQLFFSETQIDQPPQIAHGIISRILSD